MNWYLAKMVFKITIGEEKNRFQFDEQLRLIMANDETDAFHKARQTGIQESSSYCRDDKLIQWTFVNISELYKLTSMLDGAELYSNMYQPENAILYMETVHKKAANILKNSTQVFAIIITIPIDNILFREKKIRVIFIFGWIIWIALQVQIIHGAGFAWRIALWDSILSNILLAGACIIISNTLRFYLPRKNKYPVILAWSLALAGFWSVIIHAVLKSILIDDSAYVNFLKATSSIRFWISALIISWTALVSLLWHRQKEDSIENERKEDIERLSKEAELYKLRHQLQPHFLFNSLNSISALVTSKPEEARKMIQHLSDFLRGTLKKEEHSWVTLEEELQLLELYLDVEKVRFGYRLHTEIIKDENAIASKLPPMLLQPVIENAIKFSLYETIGMVSIRIIVSVADNYLTVTVQNPFDPSISSPRQGIGFGLSSIQRRLYLLFGRNDLLLTSSNNELFTTIVKIPLHDQGNNNR